ncbi:hypothetical protein BST44_08300 [Mycobacterium scrofulaceum]|uniref:DUF3631 domain-containing protein n=2 Tax=Mycobacterium scrofulaceum TaxID=1783 RepID=A0A1X0KHD8_MYCSC|nr:hypothetical protein BST44_08300 [Mycobacterium scrofulaceum]
MDGCTVLDAVADFLARFIAYPNEHARYAHTLWLAHTWRMDEWESTPRLAFMSPEKGSGKTRALEVSEHLVPRAVRVSQATTGYVLAKVSQDPRPTLFYDEIDTVYGQKARGNEDLRAVLNAGHRRDGTAGRGLWGPDGLTGQDYSAYCAVALAGLGGLPDTIADRAVVIAMKKRKHTERVESWRGRVHRSEAKELGERLSSWMENAVFGWPEKMPVQDRTADVWEALVMVADAAGSHWPTTARMAAVALSSSNEDKCSHGVVLLRDVQTVFGDTTKMSTQDILAGLCALPESRWNHFHGQGSAITDRDLSRLLKPYGIHSKDVWVCDRSAKGYTADDLRDAWERYVHPSTMREVREVGDGLEETR